MRRARAAPLVLAVALAHAAWGGGLCAAEGKGITLTVDKPEIRITSGFHGDFLRAAGTAPADCGVILRLTSARGGETLDVKGKLGLFWLTVGKVRFEGAPRVYMLRSTRPVEALLQPQEQAREDLGIFGLRSALRVQSHGDSDILISEFLRMKRDRGLYGWTGGGVARGPEGKYEAEFSWPAHAPSGTYTLTAFAVKGGGVTSSASSTILVRKVGLEAWISRLGERHGVLYGVLAVLIALAAGVAAGAVFGGSFRKEKKAGPGRESA